MHFGDSELILERAGPVIFRISFLDLTAFRQIPVICPARRAKPENYWKRELIPNKAYPANKPVVFHKSIPGKHFSESDIGCGFFAYNWKLPAYSGAFLLTVDNCGFSTYSWSFSAYSFSFFTYSWSFFAYSGKVRLERALTDCKQRSLTVNKKAPTVSKRASPL